MGRVLAGYEPAKVLEFFEEICGIPHPSFHEKEISDYLVRFAAERDLTYFQDDAYNVIIIKDATPDKEDHEPIIIQGHIDMVAEKDLDCTKNMLTDPIDIEVVDGCVTAKGTTLGADNGIAVAMAMALLDDEELSHPRLECIFTTCEEVTMGGVARVDVTPIEGKTFLNLDSEEEGEIICGCAGGVKSSITVNMKETEKTFEELGGKAFKINIVGLTGGHSGSDIDKGRANANLVLVDMLNAVYDRAPFGLVSMNGGSKVNAIPRYSSAVVVGGESVKAKLESASDKLMTKWAEAEPDMSIAISEIELNGDTLVCTEPKKLFNIATDLPTGVLGMSKNIEGLVETSNNLGIVVFSTTESNSEESVPKGIAAFKMQGRSSRSSALDKVINDISAIAEENGGVYAQDARYPAWEYEVNSELRERFASLYEEMTGKKAKINVVHAGLECGLFAEKIPGLDCISVGPDLFDVHSPFERMPIDSVERTYALVREFIRRS